MKFCVKAQGGKRKEERELEKYSTCKFYKTGLVDFKRKRYTANYIK